MTTDIVTSKNSKKKAAALFAVIVLVWLVFDRLTKAYFEGAYELGQAGTNCGLFRFTLVHNTAPHGACSAIRRLPWASPRASRACSLCSCSHSGKNSPVMRQMPLKRLRSPWCVRAAWAMLSTASVSSTLVDFIDFTFIDFPVFNVADIGVTCGFVLLVIGYLLATRKEDAHV